MKSEPIKSSLTLEWSDDPTPVLRLTAMLDRCGKLCAIEFSAVDSANIEAASAAAYELGLRHAQAIYPPVMAGDTNRRGMAARGSGKE